MEKLKKGDDVIVIAGKDKGKRGVVLRAVGCDGLVVEGVNRVKRHTKANPMKGLVGGITEKEMPINTSNVAVFNKATGKADRVGFKVLDDGRKVRVFKGTGEVVGV
ncbi:MAG: 50S ribosomal protein L24 [Rhodocyclaceae bacterium]|jgi:large subunit ribosomal protein L24|nr:50S ribosomal protein L24 [Rhodocyclaceae bacterium]MBK6905891.1 50S ribosomal protein L24 [Rhodocyclaceae bacterium]